jgi:MFS family permease
VNAFRAYRALLTNGSLTRLLVGEFVSSIGDWLYLVALLVVVYARTQDPVLLGIVGATRVLPYVLLSVPAGIVADRFDRRRILIATDAARGAIMVALAYLVATDGPVEWIVALAILATCFSTFFGPTIGAYLPTLVADERQLGPANSAWATLDNLAFALGPAIAGVLIAIGGLTLAFVLNAVSFAIVAVVLAGLPSTAPPSTAPLPEASTDEGIAPSGPAAPPSQPFPARVVLGLAAVDVVSGFTFGGVAVLTVVLAATVYGTGEAGTGGLNAAIGVGGILGAIVSGVLVLRPGLPAVLVGGGIVTALGIAILGLTEAFAVALVALAIASTGSLVLEVIGATIFQRSVPDAVRGRALGAIATTGTLAYSLGAFSVPILADAIGLAPILIGCAVAVALTSVLTGALLGGTAAEPTAPEPALVARLAALPVFAGVSPAALDLAASRLRPRPVSAGERVIVEGEVADRFYVAESGLYRVTQGGAGRGEERFVRDLPAPAAFGEIGLLRSSPRTASVTALTPGRLLELDGADFLRLVGSDAGLGPRLLDLHRGRGSDASPAPPVSAS